MAEQPASGPGDYAAAGDTDVTAETSASPTRVTCVTCVTRVTGVAGLLDRVVAGTPVAVRAYDGTRAVSASPVGDDRDPQTR